MLNKKTKLLFLAILFLGVFGLAEISLATTPAISNVSGTIATGQTLTINGANMEDENKTNWDSFFTTYPNSYGFEGTSPALDHLCAIGPCYGTYDATIKLMGSKSIKFNTAGVHTANLVSYNAFNMDTQTDRWYRWYARWSSYGNLWPTSHIKMFYPGGGSGAGTPFLQPEGGVAFPTRFTGGYNTANTYYDIPNGQLQADRWYLFEVHADSDNKHFTAWMDGYQVLDTDVADVFQQNYIRFGMVNECCNSNGSFDLSHWWDGLAVSTTRIYPSSVIEISNNAIYGSGTVVYQEPVYLSDNSVQIKINLMGLGNEPYYIWVTNNRQERSAAYNLSGGGDITSPAAPSGLSVN